MDTKNEKPAHELEPIIEYEDCTDYVPSAEQTAYEEEIIRRMKERRRLAERRRVQRNRTIAVILLLAIILLIVRGCSKNSGGDPAEDSSSAVESKPSANAEVNAKASENPAVNNGEQSEHDIKQINGMTFVDDILIVNKTYSLPADYDPGTSSVAQNAFDKMAADALNDGIYLYVNSGYRSYQEQVQLYTMYASERGIEEADRVSSRPGHSEHQTGLTFDVNSTEFSFADTEEAKWLAEHCCEYGFIIRFPEGKEDKTGYEYEPWHIRYLGEEQAKAVTESGLCLEEYLGVTSDYKYADDADTFADYGCEYDYNQ